MAPGYGASLQRGVKSANTSDDVLLQTSIHEAWWHFCADEKSRRARSARQLENS